MNSHAVVITKLQEQPSLELIKCVNILRDKKTTDLLNCDNQNLRNINKELFKRIINPFYLISLILVSLFLVILSKENINYLKLRFLIFIGGIIILILSESLLGYISDINSKNLLLLVIPFVIFLTTYFLIFKNLKIKFIK